MHLKRRHIGGKWLAMAILLAFSGSCINEDLSDCGLEYEVSYEVKLETNIQTELETNLETLAEKELGKQLVKALSNVFTKKVKDFDLRFYAADSSLSHQEKYVFNPPRDNFTKTLYLPAKDYQHIAMANNEGEKNIMLAQDEKAHTMAWMQQVSSTGMLDSYEHGLFSGRLKMEVKDVSETFYVKVYMQNSAAALIIDPGTTEVKGIQGSLDHLANGFLLRDSVYVFHDDTSIRAIDLQNTGSNLRCLYGVGFPSRDHNISRATVDDEEDDCIWQIRVQVTLADGKVVPSILHVKSPLKAGKLKIIKVKLDDKGNIVPVNSSEVGASADLEWKPGGEYNPEL